MKRLLKICVSLLLVCACVSCSSQDTSLERAEKRARAFADAVNYEYENPKEIYQYLAQDFKDKMAEEAFVEAFKKERSYPYLTPLFINNEKVELAEDQKSGTAVFEQAARLPGMYYTVSLVYENGDYFIMAFDDFLDGSYLEKFDRLSYSLDDYFDFDADETGN